MLNVIKIIILGIVSAILAIVAEQAIGAFVNIFWNQEIIFDMYEHFTWFLILAAIIEEASKFWAIYFVMKKKLFLKRKSFILGSILLGFIWGFFEIALILFSNQRLIASFQSGIPGLIFSFSSMISLHALTAFLMATFLSAGIFSRPLKMIKTLFFPILIHLLFNFLIIQRGNFTNYLIVFLLALFFLITSLILSFNLRKLA